MEQIELVEDYPSSIAQMLINDEVDVGLIPVAATLQLPRWHRVTNYGIAADGEVASVCIFSQVPIDEVSSILLDYQSRTSVNLARILLKEYWKVDPVLVPAAGEDFRQGIQGNVAAVVIGDRALEERMNAKYIYDLSAAWKAHTGLPFVFAAWIANKELPGKFVEDFNEANAYGVKHIPSVVMETSFPKYDLNHYFVNCIHYRINKEMETALQLFLTKLKTYQTL